MCYFCHNLGHNPYAQSHLSRNCCDKANTYSKVPMHKRTCDTSEFTCNGCNVMIDMSVFCRICNDEYGKLAKHCFKCHNKK